MNYHIPIGATYDASLKPIESVASFLDKGSERLSVKWRMNDWIEDTPQHQKKWSKIHNAEAEDVYDTRPSSGWQKKQSNGRQSEARWWWNNTNTISCTLRYLPLPTTNDADTNDFLLDSCQSCKGRYKDLWLCVPLANYSIVDGFCPLCQFEWVPTYSCLDRQLYALWMFTPFSVHLKLNLHKFSI